MGQTTLLPTPQTILEPPAPLAPTLAQRVVLSCIEQDRLINAGHAAQAETLALALLEDIKIAAGYIEGDG